MKESGLLVVVLRESDRAPVENALVLIQGATSATKKTGKDGIAFFKPVDPGSYTINVTLPSDIARDYVKPDAATQAVAEGSCPIKVIHAEQLAALKVHVYHKDEPAKGVGGTNIEIPAGAQALSARKTNDGDGIADFGKTKAGKYTIRATLKESVEKNFTLVFHTKDVTLKPGKETVVPLEVVQHVVTPKIEMEYMVVLLNAKLPDPDSAIKTDPTYIVVSAEQSRKSNPFKGTGKLKCSPANVEAFLDEACTKKLPGKALPVKVKVSDAKTKDQAWWIQGKTATNKLREARLHLGIDRAKGGLAKKPKNNGDWGRLSVVEIKDATVYFMLAPDKNNRKAANWGKDMPATWKWKDIDSKVKHLDKTGRKKILHLSAKTDDKGYAKAELTLSRFGGDVFWPACYIGEDPHLAKFVDGHADLEKRKPVKASHSVAVWRKFWYQEVKVAGLNVAGFGDAARTYEDVKAEMLASPVVEMTEVKANTISPKVIYKKHMVSFYLNNTRTAYVNNYPGDNGEALVVGDDNRSEFFKLAKPESDKPVAIPMLNAHALWVKDGLTSTATIPFFNATGFPKRFSASKKLLDPPLQGGDLVEDRQLGGLGLGPGCQPRRRGMGQSTDRKFERGRRRTGFQ